MQQLTINFSRQNTKENQAILNANKERFNNQCQIVYDALLRGERLTSRSAMIDYGIGHLPRRIKDLIDNHHIEIKTKLIENRFKEYYL